MAGSNRRIFLMQATGAATALAGTATAASAANDKVVIGVMGLSRGRALAEGFARQPNVQVKYVCDVDRTRAESAAAALNKAGHPTTAIQDFRRILDDKSVDALACAAPNHWHAPATILGCAAGKHVYVEKPCSHNPHEGELMVQAARKHRRVVQMGVQRRSAPRIREAIEAIKEGAIGRVYCSRAWYASLRGPIGIGKAVAVPAQLDYDLWQGPAPRRPYLDNRVHYNWHWFWHWGNGELGNNGVHALDLCRWGLGVDYPMRTTSAGGRYRFNDDQETPDSHAVAFEFADKKLITWEGLSCNKHSSGFVTFYGEKGTIELEGGGSYVLYDEADKVVKKVKGPLGESEHFANFLDAIRNDKPLELHAEIEEGHKSTLLCHLGNIAHRTGRVIATDTGTGHIVNDPAAQAFWRREYESGWEPKV